MLTLEMLCELRRAQEDLLERYQFADGNMEVEIMGKDELLGLLEKAFERGVAAQQAGNVKVIKCTRSGKTACGSCYEVRE